MEKAKHSVQFEAEIGSDGILRFEKSLDALKLQSGSKVTVTIVGGVFSKKLTTLGVTENEIEMIGTMQLEERENIVRFLSSQGVMKNNTSFIQRAMRVK
jgi:hypothetical protein